MVCSLVLTLCYDLVDWLFVLFWCFVNLFVRMGVLRFALLLLFVVGCLTLFCGFCCLCWFVVSCLRDSFVATGYAAVVLRVVRLRCWGWRFIGWLC